MQLHRFLYMGTFVLFLLMGCKQEEFSFNYSSSKTPQGSLVLGSGQTAYTQNRTVQLQLNSSSNHEMAFFVNTSCVYKEATSWESYASTKTIELPDEDGVYNIAVIYRSADHFPSECQTVKVVLDRVGPLVPLVSLVERTSSTTATPSFSFSAATDVYSPIASYEARVLSSTTSAVILDWTTINDLPEAINTLTVVLAGGSSYVVEVRAKDEAGNYGPGTQSKVFYAGLVLSLVYLNDSGAQVNCSTATCTLQSGVYKFQVSLSFPISEDITVNFATQDYTAYAGLDYYTSQGTQQIASGSSTISFLVNIHETYQPGPQRYFSINFKSDLSPSTLSRNILLRKFDATGTVAKSTSPSFESFGVGSTVSCGLTTAHDVYCWGARAETSPNLYPYPFGMKIQGFGSEDVIQVAPTYRAGCALTASKQVKCWYNVNFSTFLTQNYSTATDLPDFNDVIQFAVAPSSFSSVICGVQTNGTILCAGSNSKYQTGSGSSSTTSVATSNLVQGFSNVGVDPVATKVALGTNSACALTTVGSVYCWGRNNYGQVGINTTTTYASTAQLVSGLPTARDIYLGNYHACAVTTDDRLFCWGLNASGQLGLALTTINSYTPVEITGQTGITTMALGYDTSCALRTVTGVSKLFCWGKNSTGAMGPYWGVILTPKEVSSYSGTPTAITSLGSNLCVVNTLGEIRCAGAGSGFNNSEMGLPAQGDFFSTAVLYSPSNPKWSMDVQDITLQNESFCHIDSSNKAYCHGINTLTNPYMTLDDTYALEPTLLTNSSVQSIGIGKRDEFRCFVDTDKKVWCKGVNSSGQLGDGTTTDSSTFKQISSLTNIKTVGSGRNYSCALSYQSEVYCWGYNGYGQIGMTPVSPYIISTPHLMTNMPAGNISKLAVGWMTACALMESGSIYCWGYSANGELGNGTTTATHTPGLVTSAQTFKDIYAHDTTLCAIATGGGAYCWGDNTNGQVGDGTTVNKLIPTQVSMSSGAGFTSLSPTSLNTCGTTVAGEVYCWGWGSNGNLGTGLTTSSTTPVKVSNIGGGAVKVVTGLYQGSSTIQSYSCVLIKINGTNQDVKCWGGNSLINLGFPQGVGATPWKLKIDSLSP